MILVDDGSTDNSLTICKEWEKRDHRVKVIAKHNEGRVLARNVGLANAIGEWVVYVDSDDLIENSMLSEMMDIQVKYNVDVVIAPKMVRDIAPSMCSKLFRKMLLEQYQHIVDPTITYGEDMLCVRLCMLNVQSIYIMGKSFYHYTTNHGQRKYDSRYIENIFLIAEILNKYIKLLDDEEIRDKIHTGLMVFVIKSTVNFGFGTVFGSSNAQNVFKKVKKVKSLSKNLKIEKIKIDNLKQFFLVREIHWWYLFVEKKIVWLYFEVRLYALGRKIKKKWKTYIKQMRILKKY